MNKLTREDFYEAVKGPNEGARPSLYETQYYLRYFDKLGDRERFIMWNWAAFFADGAWMFYRRMFGYASVLILVNLISLYFIIDAVVQSNYWAMVWPISVHLGIKFWLGLFGNIIYTAHVRRMYAKGKMPVPVEGDILWAYFAIHLIPVLIASF